MPGRWPACVRTCREGAAPRSARRRLSRSRSARMGSTSHASGTSMLSVRMRPLGSPENAAAGRPGSASRPSSACVEQSISITEECKPPAVALVWRRPLKRERLGSASRPSSACVEQSILSHRGMQVGPCWALCRRGLLITGKGQERRAARQCLCGREHPQSQRKAGICKPHCVGVVWKSCLYHWERLGNAIAPNLIVLNLEHGVCLVTDTGCYGGCKVYEVE